MTNPFDPGYYRSDELRTFGFASVGDNVMIAKNCTIIGLENISIGDHVRIDAFSSIIATGTVRIGSYVHIGGTCHIAGRGGVTLGDFAGLSQGVRIYSASDDYTGAAMTNPLVPPEFTLVHEAPVKIGRHAIVGSGSVILPGCEVGEGAAIGALSMVSADAPAWMLVGGCPARPLRARERRPLMLEHELISAAAIAA